jgi:hypothetical protein
MRTKHRAAEDDTDRAKESVDRVTNVLTDQDGAEMKKNLENAGYKAKEAATE